MIRECSPTITFQSDCNKACKVAGISKHSTSASLDCVAPCESYNCTVLHYWL